MSREVVFKMLHEQVIKLLEKMGDWRLAAEVEREGEAHEVYTFLDRALSMYYAEYGGVNCKWLEEEIRRDYDRVVKVVLPALLRQYVSLRRRGGGKPALPTREAIEETIAAVERAK